MKIKQIYLYYMMTVIMMILVTIMVLMSVAFLTLLERKFLGIMQNRKGPNKLGINGILQPFSDAIKLMVKEMFFMIKLNYLIYVISPMLSLIMILLMWVIYPFYMDYLIMMLGFLYLLCCLSMGVYSFMFSGWSSNSMYSLLGSLRTLAQSISYEVSLAIILIIPMFLVNSMNFIDLKVYFMNLSLSFILWPLSLAFLISIMAELNRAPFDFSEGESELVSGFNVEYMSSGFILLFLSEYASILFMSYLYNLFFFGLNKGGLFFFFNIMIIMILIIWIRGSLPRLRYDLLMNLCWLEILPLSLNYMLIMLMFKKLIWLIFK